MRHFRELRIQVVETRAHLRQTKDLYEVVKAEATQRAAVTGKNAEERAVALTLALNSDAAYQTALGSLRQAEYNADRATELLEAACDERRAAEWQIRAKLADGLFRAGVPHEHNGDEFDETADQQADEAMARFYDLPVGEYRKLEMTIGGDTEEIPF